MFQFGSLVVANMIRNRRRTVLTVASIAFSLCLVSVLAAMYEALFANPEASPAQALRLVTHHRVSITMPMPVAYESRIRRIPGVQDAMVWQWFGGTYRDARDSRNLFARFAVEPERFFNIKNEIKLPNDQKAAFQHLRTSCIVGTKLAERFGWKSGDRISILGDIFPVNLELTLVGIYTNSEDEETLFFNYEYLRQLIIASGQADSANAVGVFLVLADRAEDVDEAAAAIDKQFENSSAPTKSESERAWQLSFISFLGNLKLFFVSISGALMFTILLVSGNTIAMSIRERVREVGILKTLGLTQRMILGIFLGECSLLGMMGGLFGLVLGATLCAGIRYSKTAFAALNLAINWEVGSVVLLTAIVTVLASSCIPAWSASRTPILKSIQHAG